jgi:8-oxo-dGTP diphosphatase
MADKGRYVYEWPRPMVTADAAVFSRCDEVTTILLVQRKRDPYQDHWALPGGFVEMDEDLPAAAARELREETGLCGIRLEQLRAFGTPGRDPRGRVITVAYVGVLDGPCPAVNGSDDAAEARWFDVADLPPLAFDHGEIIRYALQTLTARTA